MKYICCILKKNLVPVIIESGFSQSSLIVGILPVFFVDFASDNFAFRLSPYPSGGAVRSPYGFEISPSVRENIAAAVCIPKLLFCSTSSTKSQKSDRYTQCLYPQAAPPWKWPQNKGKTKACVGEMYADAGFWHVGVNQILSPATNIAEWKKILALSSW